jgi:hypothetical protein
MNKKVSIVLAGLAILILFGFANRDALRIRHLLTNRNIPDKPEAKEIVKTVERAYDIEAEALYTFDLQKFPSVFINDPRFPVTSGTLRTVRELTDNPTLESAGWLDYKIAYYSWVGRATFNSEAVHKKAKDENRELTPDERKSLVDSKGRMAPARAEDPIRHRQLIFMSVNPKDDIATVILDDGPTTIELTVVLVDKHWYIAGLKGISIHP